MTWINLLKVILPGIILGIALGKLLTSKTQYIKLIKPKYWIREIKKATLKQWIRFITLSIIFGHLMLFVQLGVGYVVISFLGPLLSPKNIFTNIAGFSLPIFIISISFLPIFEEWIFRGVLLEEIAKISQSKVIGLIVSSLLFAIFHLSNPGTYLVATIPYFVGGLMLGTSYLSGGLAVAIVAHILYNLLPFIYP